MLSPAPLAVTWRSSLVRTFLMKIWRRDACALPRHDALVPQLNAPSASNDTHTSVGGAVDAAVPTVGLSGLPGPFVTCISHGVPAGGQKPAANVPAVFCAQS